MKELKDVIHYYLPHEVEMQIAFSERNEIHEDGLYLLDNALMTWLDFENDDIFLKLKPLSDLTNEIDHKGEKFVPLVKLFEMISTSNYIDYDGDFSNPSLQIDDGWNHCLSYGDTMISEISFSYDSGGSFYLMVDQNVQLISEQLSLFEKLLEWNFDLWDLIESNQSIKK